MFKPLIMARALSALCIPCDLSLLKLGTRLAELVQPGKRCVEKPRQPCYDQGLQRGSLHEGGTNMDGSMPTATILTFSAKSTSCPFTQRSWTSLHTCSWSQVQSLLA